MFWADELIKDILKVKPQKKYMITDWKTPSGIIHIGALRGVVIHDIVRTGLAEKGKKAIFQYGFDDYDPMDGLPVYIPKSYAKYMGMPLSEIPAPDGKSANFAEQYANEFKEVLKQLGYNPQFVKTSELYKKGIFDEAIKIILDNAAVIRQIYLEVSGSKKSDDWFPLHVVCPKCGKSGMTKVIGWDGEKVKFQCLPNLVKWAKGCGYNGETAPFMGAGKLPWKVEWPAKWHIFGSDIEGEGKDHATVGGSRDIANEIYEQVFNKKPPYDIPYEWMLVSGAKMSTSKGVGVSAGDITKILPANIIRFLFTRTKNKKTIDFSPLGDGILNLYDDFDRAQLAYTADPKCDQARAYYYSESDWQKEPLKYLLRFSKVAYLLQMPRADIKKYAESEKGQKLTKIELEEIKRREKIANEWLEVYAPEEMKFVIQDKLPPRVKELNPRQKKYLRNIRKKLTGLDEWQGEPIHKILHAVKSEMGISPQEAFQAIYIIFLGKLSGPQAGWLMGALNKKMVIERLKEGGSDETR